MRGSFVCALLAAVALSACGGPSVNQAYKYDVDRKVERIVPSREKYDAPAAPDPMPLGVGQWSMYRLKDEKGQPGFITYNVVGEEGGAFWIESLNESYTNRLVTLMLVDLGDRKDPGTVSVKQFKQKDGDHDVNEMPAALLGMMKPMWGPLVESLVVDWRQKPQELMDTRAGTFDGCYKARATVAFAGKKWTSDTWSHPAVPISGAVRSRGVDQPSDTELVQFGLTGAKSELMK